MNRMNPCTPQKDDAIEDYKHHNYNGPCMHINYITARTTFPNSCDDLSYKLKQPIDFEAFLNSDLLEATRNEYKTHCINMPCCAHITSFAPWFIHHISSVGVWTIYRRHHVIICKYLISVRNYL